MMSLLSNLDYTFKNEVLLTHALTHPSFFSTQKEKLPVNHFERLEFVGDRVLGLIVGDMLYREFNEADEGELARRLAWLVCRETLAGVANQMNIPEHFKYARATNDNNTQWLTFLSDACEAVIGAVYFDSGLEAAQAVVAKFWTPLLHQAGMAAKDFKTQLQEYAQARFKVLPSYRILQKEGPAHEPIITVECTVRQHVITAKGGSKKSAENECAQQMLQKLTNK